jgi:hypothetical protein
MMKPAKPKPWKTKKAKTGKKMTPEQVEAAKKRAYENGRPYPNLIDNMAILRMSKGE